MTAPSTVPVADALRRLAGQSDRRPDEVLLAAFTGGGDETAFAALVNRHGGLVLDVCRAILKNRADAEDAFQATFLALATYARSVRRPAALAGWLYGTATRVARKARRARGRRRGHELRATRPAAGTPDPSWAEVRTAIHEEVRRLPERYRAAVVLYYLAGKTQDEVAAALGLSKDGAKKRLVRGRAMLRAALGCRGFAPAALMATTVIHATAVPVGVAASAARIVATGHAPPSIRALIPCGIGKTPAIRLVSALSVVGAVLAVGVMASRSQPPDPSRRPDLPAAAKAAVDSPPTAPRARFTLPLAEHWTGRCAFLDNDRVLVRAGSSTKLDVRDAKTGKLVTSVGGDRLAIGDFRLSADRKWVAAETSRDPVEKRPSAPAQADVTVWDTATWKVRGTVEARTLLAISPDSPVVLVKRASQIEVWDAAEGKRLRVAPFEVERVDAAQFSPTAAVAAVSGSTGVFYWKWRTGVGDQFDQVRVDARVEALAFAPDGKLVAEGPNAGTQVTLRDVATMKVARTLTDPSNPRLPLVVGGMTFTDAGRVLVFGNEFERSDVTAGTRRVQFWDVGSGRLIYTVPLKGGPAVSLDVSPDGTTLATVTRAWGVYLSVHELGLAGGTLPRR